MKLYFPHIEEGSVVVGFEAVTIAGHHATLDIPNEAFVAALQRWPHEATIVETAPPEAPTPRGSRRSGGHAAPGGSVVAGSAEGGEAGTPSTDEEATP